MAYSNFNCNGYDYLTEGNYVLFSCDGMHDDLFKYASTDICSLSKLLKKYVFLKMNPITFDLKHPTKSSDTIFKIIELMKSSHPYYCYEYKKVIIEAIGEYFNELLVYSVYNKHTISPESPLQKKWYLERFTELMPPFIHDDKGCYPKGLYPDDFFYKYRNWVDDKDFDTRDSEEFLLAIPRNPPSGFSREITTHKIVCDILYFILDTAAEGLKDLSISQRIWLYGNLFYTNEIWNQTQITKQLTFTPPIIYKENGNYRQEAEYKNKIYKLFEPIYVLRSLGYEYEKISTLVPKSLNSIIDYAKKYGISEIYEKYEINCLRELLLQEIISMIQSDTKIRKCVNCNRYFGRVSN